MFDLEVEIMRAVEEVHEFVLGVRTVDGLHESIFRFLRQVPADSRHVKESMINKSK